MAELTFHYSTINAGKTALFLQTAFNYEENGFAINLFSIKKGMKVNLPDGSVKTAAQSRTGLNKMVSIFDEKTDFSSLNQIKALLIDEAQFLTADQVGQLCKLVDDFGIDVICYGLRNNLDGELFKGSAALMSKADQLVEMKTLCHCGAKASQGAPCEGKEKFRAVCRKHFGFTSC